ncbi:hypothetical protein LZ31DRAFT_550253 [Colletotrichum somersetense]|nr:hypothetical protein LZ31DRAFT_550253 [Colletotrichum somersetense]
MTVTEFALLQFKEPLTEELKELMDYCQTVQDTWVLRQQPGLPPNRVDRGTAMLQQVEDPSVILIAAQWDSPQAHGEWIASPENQNVMAKLMPHIHVEGPRAVLFFHLDAPIFAAPVTQPTQASGEHVGGDGGDAAAEAESKTETDAEAASKGKEPEAPAAAAAREESKADAGPPSLLTAPVLSVGRFGVRSEKKKDFTSKYAEAKSFVEEAARPYPVRGGWRIEKAAEDLEEFVMYCGWSTVEQHKAIAQREGFKEWAGIQEFVTGTDIWHYQRII